MTTRERMEGLAWERVAATGVTYRQFDYWTRNGTPEQLPEPRKDEAA